MAQRFQLKAGLRQGKSRALRHQDIIPAVLYGHGLKNQTLQVDSKTFTKIFKAAGHTSLVDLSLAQLKHTVLIREVQYHPLKGSMLHVDFYQVRLDEKINTYVPLAFVGESSAATDQGGVLIRNLDEVELEALPQDLPHDIKVDISKLDVFDQPLRVSNLTLSPGVTILHALDEVVALVQPPRSEEELEAELEEVTEDVASVEGVKEEKPVAGATPSEEGKEVTTKTGETKNQDKK